MRYGFILKNKTISSKIKISLNIEKGKGNKDKKEIFIFDFQNIKQLPNENTLGKIIVNYFLKNKKTIDKETEIKLSKDFSIISSNTAFFAEIENEITVQEDIAYLSNENKTAINNDNVKKENLQVDTISNDNLVLNESNSDYLNDLNIWHEKMKKKRWCFCNFLSNLLKKKKINKKYSFIKNNKIVTRKIKINTINSSSLPMREKRIKRIKRHSLRNITKQKNEKENYDNYSCNCVENFSCEKKNKKR